MISPHAATPSSPFATLRLSARGAASGCRAGEETTHRFRNDPDSFS
jgi:hypothetical protein